jgi:hypothetical protein
MLITASANYLISQVMRAARDVPDGEPDGSAGPDRRAVHSAGPPSLSLVAVVFVVFVFVVKQQLFRVMESVDTGLPVIQVWWRNPLSVAVLVFAGKPAFFGKRVVTAATECQVVDVGGAALGVGLAVMDFAVIARHAASWCRTPTILGVQHYSLGR